MTADTWQSYFTSGERLLWEGAPARGIHHPWRLLGWSVFGVPFLAAGLTCWAIAFNMLFEGGWMVLAGLVLAAFGVPFVGVGVMMVAGGWWEAAVAHRKVRYALSTRRAYIARNHLRRNLESYPIERDSRITLTEGKGGYGSVQFHFLVVQDSEGRSTETAAFENVEGARGVFDMVRRVQSGEFA
jgi:hypothetical protein